MTFSDYMDYLRGKRIGVIGFGVSNQPLVRVLLRNGCDVTVCDRRDRAKLGAAGDEAAAQGAKFILGADYLEHLDFDVIFRTPGVLPIVPQLRAAAGGGGAEPGPIAVAYHGGMLADRRGRAQRDFVTDRVPVVVATNAFGMGIDKPNVRFVAHVDMPKSIEGYFQETGRAGRDGEPADAWMAYGLNDVVNQRFFIAASAADEMHKQLCTQKLDAMLGLAEAPDCRRQRSPAVTATTASSRPTSST